MSKTTVVEDSIHNTRSILGELLEALKLTVDQAEEAANEYLLSAEAMPPNFHYSGYANYSPAERCENTALDLQLWAKDVRSFTEKVASGAVALNNLPRFRPYRGRGS